MRPTLNVYLVLQLSQTPNITFAATVLQIGSSRRYYKKATTHGILAGI